VSSIVLASNIPFNGGNFAQLTANGIVSGSAYVLVAVGFGIIVHVTGRFHIAYAAIYALTAFLAAQLQISYGVPFVAALVIATLAGVVVAVLIELAVYGPIVARVGRHSLFSIAIASLGLSTAIEALINIIWPNPITNIFTISPVTIGPFRLTNLTIEAVITTWILIFILAAVIRWTNLGRMIRAVRVNPELSLDFGITPRRIYLVVFAIGTALGGVGAVFLAAQTAPASDIGENLVVFALTAAFIVGAARTPLWIAVVALGMGLLQAWSLFFIGSAWSICLIFSILTIYVAGRAARTVNWSRILTSAYTYRATSDRG
jgi:branched-chain amino acid transport system permease protein